MDTTNTRFAPRWPTAPADVTFAAACAANLEASIARTETRALAIGADARSRFRRYWTICSPGIVLIRRIMLKRVKRDSERVGQRPPRHRAIASSSCLAAISIASADAGGRDRV